MSYIYIYIMYKVYIYIYMTINLTINKHFFIASLNFFQFYLLFFSEGLNSEQIINTTMEKLLLYT